jgi:hypothetical protein
LAVIKRSFIAIILRTIQRKDPEILVAVNIAYIYSLDCGVDCEGLAFVVAFVFFRFFTVSQQMFLLTSCCFLVLGVYQLCSHEGLLYSNPPVEFRHSSPEALHTKRCERPLLAKDGTKAKEFS